MQITYQKKDGSVIQRYRNTTLPYKIGDITSMGWLVLNVEYEYEGNYYPENEYFALIYNKKKEAIEKRQRRELYIDELKKFSYYFIASLAIKFVTILLGI